MTSPTELSTRARNKVRRLLVKHAGRRSFPIAPKVPYISFTFDDFPQSALREGGRILEDHGLRGTYYMSMKLAGGPSPSGTVASHDDVRDAVARGHEVGCHTFAHLDGCDSTVDAFERSIVENRTAYERVVPGGLLSVFAYPLDGPVLPIKRAIGRRFVCCRGGGQAFNAGSIDLNLLKAYFLDYRNQTDLEAVKDIIDRNTASRGWLIFATHDVANQPSRFGVSPRFFESVVRQALDSGARILPVLAASHELRVPMNLANGHVNG